MFRKYSNVSLENQKEFQRLTKNINTIQFSKMHNFEFLPKAF